MAWKKGPSRYYYRFRGDVYAHGPVTAQSKAELREWLRRRYDWKRLPAGTEIWEA